MNFKKRAREIEEFLDQKNEVNEYLVIDQLTNDLERILENDVSTKQQTSKKYNSIVQINSMNTARTLTILIHVHEH